ncbi:uncharacterized protein [Drosophila bipectinata]|uniref:uncharacterized protein n=1 Tax=Drosophila bipectinata TaxID=42026 RepID=UPI0038B24263
MFVANRVIKITQFTDVQKWAHVRSEQNLRISIAGDWPTQGNDAPVTELEKQAIKVHVAKAPPEDLLERFSTLDKALRVEEHLSANEVTTAERLLISVTQRRPFVFEMGCLSEKRPISASSPIQNLNPFVDSQGLMRTCGRVTSSELSQYDERHPIILPYDCHLSRLLVQFTHRITLHGGNQLMIRLIRAQFWIPRVRNWDKSVIYSCKVCVIHKKKLQTQLMGELPKERTSFSLPFTYTGVDYAGPFEIKS